VFRSILDVEILADAHRDDLLPPRPSSSAKVATGPLAQTRRLLGLSLIAAGERIANRETRAGGTDGALLPASGRAH
jgi:hypothetical protein